MDITPVAMIEFLQSQDLFALVVPGGWAPDKLRRYSAVTNNLREMDSGDKIIGIIWHGGLVAISAGIVRGRRTTGSPGIKDDLVNAVAMWVDQAAFRDGNLIWGSIVGIFQPSAVSWL